MVHEFSNGEPIQIKSLNEIDFEQLKEGTIRLEKSSRLPAPTEWGLGLEPDGTGFPKGSTEMYRDSRPHGSLQVREYETHYLIQLDHANPTVGGVENVVAHYKLDVAPGQKVVLGIGALGLVYLALRSLGN